MAATETTLRKWLWQQCRGGASLGAIFSTFSKQRASAPTTLTWADAKSALTTLAGSGWVSYHPAIGEYFAEGE
tara:strand:- start:38934 stop:39152 length:219 start_codon:yes stop_codon:yes gene_type:complete